MECPTCGVPMKEGHMVVKSAFSFFRAGTLKFVPKEEGKRKTADQMRNSEGYYCEACNKIVAVFSAW